MNRFTSLLILLALPVFGQTPWHFTMGLRPLEVAAGDTTAPAVQSITLAANGTNITIVHSEAVTPGAGGNSGWTLSPSGGAATLTVAGTNGANVTGNASRLIASNETVTASYTQPGNGWEDGGGNDLATTNGISVVNNSTQAGAAYDELQGFEGAGVPNANWTQETPGTAADWDYTGTVLTGTQSLLQSDPGASGTAYVTYDFAPYSADTMYVAFKWQPTATTASAACMGAFLDAADATLGTMEWRSIDGKLTASHACGTDSASTATAASGANTYWVKGKYIKGTGANASMTVWLSSDGVSWGSGVAKTDGTGVTAPTKFQLIIFYSRNYNAIIDSFQVSQSDIAIGDIP